MELLRTLLQDKRQDQGMAGAATGAATGASANAPLRTTEMRAEEARQERVRPSPLSVSDEDGY